MSLHCKICGAGGHWNAIGLANHQRQSQLCISARLALCNQPSMLSHADNEDNEVVSVDLPHGDKYEDTEYPEDDENQVDDTSQGTHSSDQSGNKKDGKAFSLNQILRRVEKDDVASYNSDDKSEDSNGCVPRSESGTEHEPVHIRALRAYQKGIDRGFDFQRHFQLEIDTGELESTSFQEKEDDFDDSVEARSHDTADIELVLNEETVVPMEICAGTTNGAYGNNVPPLDKFPRAPTDLDSETSDTFEQGKVWVCPTMDRGEISVNMPSRLHKSVRLMMKTRTRKAPLSLYREIVDFTREEKCFSDEALLHKEEVFHLLDKHFPSMPSKTVRKLPIEVTDAKHKTTLHLEIPIITFDLWPQIYSILNDPTLMERKNLNVNCSDPYSRYSPGDQLEIQDGRMFQQFLHRFHDVEGKLKRDQALNGGQGFAIITQKDIFFTTGHSESIHMVIGLIVYVDKTFTDVLGRYNMEPVVLTLSIFNRKGRANPKAWIIVGCVTQLGHTPAQNSSMPEGQPNYIYHRQLREIFRTLHEHRSEATMQARIANVKGIRHFTFPILSYLGDGEGSDAVCGRYKSHGESVGRVAWKCMTPKRDFVVDYLETNMTGDVRCCERIDAVIVEKLTRQFHGNPKSSTAHIDALAKLKAMAQHPSILFTSEGYLLLASTRKQGIFALCCNCTLHAVDQGIVTRALDTVFARLTPAAKVAVDGYLRNQLFRKNRQSRVQTLFYRTSFKSLTHLAKLTGKEKLGVMFSWMILVRSGLGRTIFTIGKNDKIDPRKFFNHKNALSYLIFGEDRHVQTFGRLFEMLLTYERHIMVAGPHLWNPNADTETVKTSMDNFSRKVAAMMSCLFWILPKPLESELDENGRRRAKKSPLEEESVETTKRKRKRISARERAARRRDGTRDAAADCFMEEETTGVAETPPVLNVHDVGGVHAALDQRYPKEKRSWTNQKAYLLSHNAMEITDFGVCANTDTSIPECNHKKFAKLPASAASKKGIGYFALSVAERIAEMLRLDHAESKLFLANNIGSEPKCTRDLGKKFFITEKEQKSKGKPDAYLEPRSESEIRKRGYQVYKIPQTVLNYVRLRCDNGEFAGDFRCSTECRLSDGMSVRCSPMFQGNVVYDWVWIAFDDIKQDIPKYLWECDIEVSDDFQHIPCQVACVVLDKGGHSISQEGSKVLVVRPCLDLKSDNNLSLRSKIVKRWRKLYHLQFSNYQRPHEPVLCCVCPSKVRGQVIVYEDFFTLFESKDTFTKERDSFLRTFCDKKYWHGKPLHERGIAYLRHDWVYSVAHKNEWPHIFDELCLPATKIPGSAATTYQPPDPPSVPY